MVAIGTRLKSFLEEKGLPFESIPHRCDFTAQETAAVRRASSSPRPSSCASPISCGRSNR